jgi:hypothetical protein
MVPMDLRDRAAMAGAAPVKRPPGFVALAWIATELVAEVYAYSALDPVDEVYAVTPGLPSPKTPGPVLETANTPKPPL